MSTADFVAPISITIRRGENVLMLRAAANRDPRVFEEPDRFDIRRDNKRYLTFGGGARICKGRHLAMLQAEIALQVLLERSKSVELTSDEFDWGPAGNIRAVQSIPVRIAAN